MIAGHSVINHEQGTAISSPIVAQHLIARSGSYVFSDTGPGKVYSDATSIRSLASIGMGSTDGRKMVIRRVPNTPDELLGVLSPQG